MSRPGTRKPAAERKKEIADAIAYAFGHWIRLEALAILAEGKFSVAEIARTIGIGVPRLSGHIRGLYDHGCIEYMGKGTARNSIEHLYRAAVIPHIDDETFRSMPPVERRESLGLVAQAVFAETLASLRAGKLDADENSRIIGRCLCVDAKGKVELQEHVLEVYEQLVEIKVKSSHRLAESKEPGTTMIVSVTGFERSRPKPSYTGTASVQQIARGRARNPASKRAKAVVDAVAYACGRGVRVEALEILAEGKISVTEVAQELGVELKSLSGYVRYLYDYGCIEDAGKGRVRNANKHFYRAVTLPRIEVAEFRDLTPEERREINGLIVQRIIAATLASFRAGKLENDEKVQLVWDCLNLDKKGKREVAKCLDDADTGLLAIAALNSKRLKESGAEAIYMMASFLGIERSRLSRPAAGYGSPKEI